MRHTLLRAFALASLLTLVVLLPAVVAAQTTQTFAQVPGIKGGSTDREYADWIVVNALRQALTPGWTTSTCNVDLVKGLDEAGPLLWSAAVTNQVFNEVTIAVRKSGENPQTIYIIKLANAHITGIVTTGAMPFAETVTFRAQKMTLSFYPQKPDGSLGTPITKTITCN